MYKVRVRQWQPSLEIWTYGHQRGDFEGEGVTSVKEAYEEWLQNKRTWFVLGVVCPHCFQKHTALASSECEHCSKGLAVETIPARHDPIVYEI